jgi:hypothetical protein
MMRSEPPRKLLVYEFGTIPFRGAGNIGAR